MVTTKSKCAIALPGKENIKKKKKTSRIAGFFFPILFSVRSVGLNYSTGTQQGAWQCRNHSSTELRGMRSHHSPAVLRGSDRAAAPCVSQFLCSALPIIERRTLRSLWKTSVYPITPSSGSGCLLASTFCFLMRDFHVLTLSPQLSRC